MIPSHVFKCILAHEQHISRIRSCGWRFLKILSVTKGVTSGAIGGANQTLIY